MGIGHFLLANFSVILFIAAYADTDAITAWTNPSITGDSGNGTAKGTIPEDMAAGITAATDIKLATTPAAENYTITSPADGMFTILNNGSVIFAKGKLDYETKSSYVITVVAKTADHAGTATVTIKITDVNDNKPVFSKPTYTAKMVDGAKNGATVINVTASDLDGTSANKVINTYLLKAANNTNTDFAIGAKTGSITVAKPLNATRTKNYVLVVEAVDSGTPTLTGSANVNICVGSCDESGAATLTVGFVTVFLAVFLRVIAI